MLRRLDRCVTSLSRFVYGCGQQDHSVKGVLLGHNIPRRRNVHLTLICELAQQELHHAVQPHTQIGLRFSHVAYTTT